MTPISVVVLDDEANMGKILTKVLRLEGFDVRAFDEPAAACEALRASPPHVLLSDLRMPGMTGEEVLDFVREHQLPTAVILMTAYGTVESAMRCVRLGAFEYVTKPFDTTKLVAALRAAAASRVPHAAADGNARPETPAPARRAAESSRDLIGISPAMEAVREIIRKVAPTDASVLISGESGTGKELAAHAIHAASLRAKAPFVAINCASIPETLMESELFGHEKGAFTGAHESRAGLMEAAGGGTLFLDEIGEMPIGLQAKLLRALQEGEITRLGSTRTTKVNMRVLAATNRRLKRAVEAGTFREDLYYRLNVLSVRMPPLRERVGDVALLAEHFLAAQRARLGKPGLRLAPEVIAHMEQVQWPGNVRELGNFIERLAVMSDSDLISDRHVFEVATSESAVRLPNGGKTDILPAASLPTKANIPDFREARDEFETNYLRAVLQACSGNVTEAARRSGVSRRHLYEKLEKYNIDPAEFKGEGTE